MGSLNQRKVTEFKIPSLSKPRRFPAGDTGLWVDDHGGPAALSRAQLTNHRLWYLLVQNFKEPLRQACVCFLSGHGHFDSVLHGQWISFWQSWEIPETTTDIAEASLTHAAVQSLSIVWLFATWWTVAHQAPLVCRILQTRILEWVATFFSSGSSRPRDWTHVSCTGRRIHWHSPKFRHFHQRPQRETVTREDQAGAPGPGSPPGFSTQLSDFTFSCASVSLSAQWGQWQLQTQGPPCLAHLGGSSNMCYFYQTNIHPGPETLPEEVEVRAPHESECKVTCKVMPLWQLQTWPCRFLKGRISSLFRTETPWSREFTWLAESGANIPYPSLFLLGTFFFPLIVPFWDIDMAANPGTKQGMETVWGNNPGEGARWVSGGRGRGVMWGLCKTFPAEECVSGDWLLKQWHLLPTSLSHHQRNDILRKIKH